MTFPGKELLLSTALFPPLEYMAILLFYPEVRIEAHENYTKQTFRNRFYILGPNGKQMLHVPVEKGNMQHCPIQKASIVHPEQWRHIHLRSLQTAYSSAPWYIHYTDQLHRFYQQLPSDLWGMNTQSIHLAAQMLGTEWEPRYTTGYIPSNTSFYDYRDRIHPKRSHPFPANPKIQPTYQQVFMDKHGFTPGLSILDLIMNEGPLALSWLQAYYHSTIVPPLSPALEHDRF